MCACFNWPPVPARRRSGRPLNASLVGRTDRAFAGSADAPAGGRRRECRCASVFWYLVRRGGQVFDLPINPQGSSVIPRVRRMPPIPAGRPRVAWTLSPVSGSKRPALPPAAAWQVEGLPDGMTKHHTPVERLRSAPPAAAVRVPRRSSRCVQRRRLRTAPPVALQPSSTLAPCGPTRRCSGTAVPGRGECARHLQRLHTFADRPGRHRSSPPPTRHQPEVVRRRRVVEEAGA